MLYEFIINNIIEITGAAIGLLYLYYEYKADIMMWPTGIIMSIFYTFIFINATFYAFACINIYYIIAGVYGWIKWHNHKKAENNNDNHGIVHLPPRLYLPVIMTLAIVYVVIFYVLREFTDSQVIYGDSFVTTLSIVAMLMLARKYAEQWLLLIVVNIVSVFLYYHQNLYPTSIMYLFYSIVSIFGYVRWLKLIKN